MVDESCIPPTRGTGSQQNIADLALCKHIDALLALDTAGALVPHGVGGHARELLVKASAALRVADASKVKAAPAAWLESEPSARNLPIFDVLNNNCHTAIWHTRHAPVTNNPVWTVYGPAMGQEPQPVPSVRGKHALIRYDLMGGEMVEKSLGDYVKFSDLEA